jgi:glycosyltransferase involved in cell wall biosynthesis
MAARAVVERLEPIKRAVDDFCRQTLVRKRLVMVLEGGTSEVRGAVRAYVAALNRHDIRVLTPSGTRPIGQLRNIGLEAATGELICLWDDEGRSHPERLAKQAAVLLGNHLEAVYLQEAMHYFRDEGAVVCGSWRTAPARGHPGTLMARRSAQLRYPAQNEMPESELAEVLMARGRTGFITGAPHLYVGLERGGGRAPDLPFGGQALTGDMVGQREAMIRYGLEAYGFPPGTAACGADGEAFIL